MFELENMAKKKLPSDHLEALLRTAKKMTPEQLAEQRRSFVYANLKLDGCDVTREMVDKADEEMNNEQKAPTMQFKPDYNGIPLLLIHIKPPHDSCQIIKNPNEPISDENLKYADRFGSSFNYQNVDSSGLVGVESSLLGYTENTLYSIVSNQRQNISPINMPIKKPRAIFLAYMSDRADQFYTSTKYASFTSCDISFYAGILYDEETVETLEYFPTVKTTYQSIPEGKLPVVKFSGRERIAHEFNIGATAKKESDIISVIKECYDVLEYKIANKIDEDRKCSDVIVTYRGKDLANVFSIHPFDKGFYINGVFSVTTNKTEN